MTGAPNPLVFRTQQRSCDTALACLPLPAAQANLCLAHHTPTSGGNDHERPRAFDNGNGVSAEEIEEESDLIRRLHFSKVTTQEMHKALADIGKKLGPAGKQKVSGRAYSLR